MKARVGGIHFINSLPIEYALESEKVAGPLDLFRTTPAELNRLISTHQLDVSPVSSIFLARSAEPLLLIPDFAISSDSGVKSVLLASRRPIEELMGVPIGFSQKGETTPALLRVLCNFRYGFEPRFAPESMEAELLIGDDALRAITLPQFKGYQVYDLAELWTGWTGFKFVFAVWVVRKNFLEDQGALFRQVHTTLLESKNWGLTHLPEIIQEARSTIPATPEFLAAYFSHIQYDLDEGCLDGLDHFWELASELKIIPQRLRAHEFAQVRVGS